MTNFPIILWSQGPYRCHTRSMMKKRAKIAHTTLHILTKKKKKNSAHNKATDKQQIATLLSPADHYPDMFKQFMEVG